MWLRWLVVITLTLALCVPFDTARQELKYPGMRVQRSNPSLFGFIKFITLYIVVHVWFSSLVLQPISWIRLIIIWIVLFNVVGWLFFGFLRINIRLNPLLDLMSDLLGVGIGFWLINRFLIP